jgi:putative transposase
MIRTYQFKLRPNREQEAALWNQLRLTRELYNQGLQELIENFQKTGKHLNRFTHDRMHGCKEHPEIPAVLVDTVIVRLHRSFENFFRRCKEGASKKGFPRFKSANRWHSLQFRDTLNGIRDTYFCAPRAMGGRMRFNRHRDIKGTIKFCRVLRKPSGWLLQVICECEPETLPKKRTKIGLDFGLTTLVTDSKGGKVENPRHLKFSLRKLRVAQRRIARRKKGSNRRRKACRIAARIHERIANQRLDYLHKTARHYVNKFGTIVIEDLSPSNMVQNRHLSRSIMDASWSMLRQLLESKAENAGRTVIAVPPHYTSQKCSKCKEMVEKSLSVRTHICPHCGYIACRDVNAAQNILQAGMRPSGRSCDERLQRSEKPRACA